MPVLKTRKKSVKKKAVKKQPSKKQTALGSKMRQKGARAGTKSSEPLWRGPAEDGITQSLLSRFLVCRERFRLLVVDGLKLHDRWNHRLGYGNMWHLCEEVFAKEIDTAVPTVSWRIELRKHMAEQCKEYPLQQEEINKWYNVCLKQFPIYIDYWKHQPHMKNQEPIMQEEVFVVPYVLPSGRVVLLKGKFDSVDAVGKRKSACVWLQENKTKADVDEEQLQQQLTFDLQTMFYRVAFDQYRLPSSQGWVKLPIAGVRYNVVRRPLSGGKHSIKQKKNQSKTEFYDELAERIAEDADFFFMRWQVEISDKDVERFKQRFLNPALEQLCDWWEWVAVEPNNPFREGNVLHWQHPYGIYNPLNEGRSTDLEDYLRTGNEVGLQRTDNLFPELE